MSVIKYGVKLTCNMLNIFYFKMLSNFNLYGFCLHMRLCDMFVPGAYGG